MNHSTLGYGAFELQDLLPGEEFVASDGTPGKVCAEQRFLPDQIEVLLGWTTATAIRMLRHPTMRVFGTSLEQARRILRRLAQRRRRAKKKGVSP